MAGNVKLMTSAGGGVILDTATTTATDVTVKVPVTGVNNGTLVCSDSSGNVGIGTATALNYGGGGKALSLDAGTSPDTCAFLSLAGGGGGADYNLGRIHFGLSSNTTRPAAQINGLSSASGASTGGILTFLTSSNVSSAFPSERMRIDSSGNLLVGTTSQEWSSATRAHIKGTKAAAFIATGDSSEEVLGCWHKANSGTRVQIYFSDTSAGGIRGSITTNGSSTAYNTSSDYRLKENIQPMQNALAVVQQLNPVTYTWKADGSDGQGFIAHELQAVVPDCVTGEKDAVDADGNPVYQGIDTSFLVATLTKAIQEQQAQIETLTAKVAALEAK